MSICEPSIVPLPDGRWLLFARESGGFLPGARFYSTDQGKTWSPPEELPFFIQGRTCAGLLADGRAMVTFRSNAGPPALWTWVGDPDEKTRPVVRGIHFNDRTSVGLKNGAFHIDNDGRLGQFTKYVFRVPDSDQSRIEVTAELKVLSNRGRAATLSVPFVGKLRFLPRARRTRARAEGPRRCGARRVPYVSRRPRAGPDDPVRRRQASVDH